MRAKTSPWVFVVAAVGGVFVLGAVIGSVVLASQPSAPEGTVKADQCIGVRFDMQGKQSSYQQVPVAERVFCDDPKAKAKVVQVVAESGSAGMSSSPDCPAGADGVARVRTGEETQGRTPTAVCARNLDGPHPGDPGVGGAMIGVGDCVTSSIAFGSETPCTDKESYAKVVARVDTAKECPSTALETMELKSFGGDVARPVLCLGGQGLIVTSGECIQDPKFAIGGLKTASCDSEQAVAKVLARTRTEGECPKGTTHNLEAEDKEKALLPIMCVKKLRPTFDERINALGS
ncbi:hypothetical protein BJF79_07715 [Actinomadura sp. CNU-125]|uniref:hypothetical protein n=1 Tax=Actinomadura sp. CNU-125 TaxID=1904961 RepID=UPI000963A437|nr:hypothetical protein [Actinomadura sp. CNU-125]OLT33780.1 hypothetical protein BJF79_07715 [Actinomadura sp. CNU-125]